MPAIFCIYLYLSKNSKYYSLSLSICCLGQRFREMFPVPSPKFTATEARLIVVVFVLILLLVSSEASRGSLRIKTVEASEVFPENFRSWKVKGFSEIVAPEINLERESHLSDRSKFFSDLPKLSETETLLTFFSSFPSVDNYHDL